MKRTKNKEQRTKNKEQRTENRETEQKSKATREQMGSRELGAGSQELTGGWESRNGGSVEQRANHWLWLGPLLYMLFVGGYFVARYEGRWAENDSAVFTKYIRLLWESGRLVPNSDDVYPNGYAYQAISAFVLAISGLDVATLQQLIYPFTAALVVLPAWILYRELTSSARGATIATILLFSQPEFLFVILRSSHEKFTRTLLLLCLYLLARSFTLHDRLWLFAAHVGLFYLTTFAFIAGNNLLAHSFIFAVAIALFLGWGLELWRKNLRLHSAPLVQRLPYAVLICLGLVYLFIFYAYEPAQHDLLVLQNLADRIAALFLDVQAQSTNAYTQVATGWISLPIYFMVSIANWIILGASFAIWIQQSIRWVLRSEAPGSANAWLLWLLYAAFAAQGGLSVIADASGALGSNLQHRIFPSMSIIAVGIVSAALAQWQPRRYQRPIRLVLTGGVACIAVLSVFKATNEPLLSNKWTFYRPDELRTLEWADSHLRKNQIWTELDERLAVAFITRNGPSENENGWYAFDLNSTTRNLIVSTVTRLRSTRLQQSLPVPPDAQRVYDNGEAQLYHRRATTPYQR
jgi:hypothetical protein